MFSFLLSLEQELEQELAEQKSLLRSVASRGEEILTQHSATEPSAGIGYVSNHFLLTCPDWKKRKHLAQNFILSICKNVSILFPLYDIKFIYILKLCCAA